MLSSKLNGCAAAIMVLLSVSHEGISASTVDDGRKLAPLFEQQVTRRLTIPPTEQEHYAQLLTSALEDARLSELKPQYFLLVDRSPQVQAAMIFWKSQEGAFYLIGATPVSTGRPGTYEHFLTPLGVYEHGTRNPDFRSQGTRNTLGIRGYGARGRRIFDFGWVRAPKGWGDHTLSRLRLQVHATDPKLLDGRLGTAQSEGCVRTTASFNAFLDHYGILDGDYEQATKSQRSWVLSSTREPTPWSGRYLVVVDSQRQERPVWARISRTPPANRAGG
ncbi:MAG TPA: L,D-transpeptidase [Vicinamibacterales bacterium]|nr:L,D-transpeptidase [Vicinamibacterales bacterium]